MNSFVYLFFIGFQFIHFFLMLYRRFNKLFLNMEENISQKGQKFSKVEQKLTMLAQSKLQNLAQVGVKQLEERLINVEKTLIEETTSIDKITREYRLKIRKIEEQTTQIEEKCGSAIRQRSHKIHELREEIAKYMHQQHQDKENVEEWFSRDFEVKSQKLEKLLSEEKQIRKDELGEFNQLLQKWLVSTNESLEDKNKISGVYQTRKLQHIKQQCEYLKDSIMVHEQKKEKGQKKLMDHLKNVIGQIKMIIGEEKTCRERNRDKIIVMLEEAEKNLLVK